jgi:hypothetical protein
MYTERGPRMRGFGGAYDGDARATPHVRINTNGAALGFEALL